MSSRTCSVIAKPAIAAWPRTRRSCSHCSRSPIWYSLAGVLRSQNPVVRPDCRTARSIASNGTKNELEWFTGRPLARQPRYKSELISASQAHLSQDRLVAATILSFDIDPNGNVEINGKHLSCSPNPVYAAQDRQNFKKQILFAIQRSLVAQD